MLLIAPFLKLLQSWLRHGEPAIVGKIRSRKISLVEVFLDPSCRLSGAGGSMVYRNRRAKRFSLVESFFIH
jgi:hypothetical protein